MLHQIANSVNDPIFLGIVIAIVLFWFITGRIQHWILDRKKIDYKMYVSRDTENLRNNRVSIQHDAKDVIAVLNQDWNR